MVVAHNLFGDILTDLGAAVAGSIGLAPSANIDPDAALPGMFEPVHGSAPDIAGKGIANPLGGVWAGALMLDHLGEADAAARRDARDRAMVARARSRTPDLGGDAGTRELADALVAAVRG